MTSTQAPNGSPLANLSPSPNDELSRPFSRSPHPYHRRSSSLKDTRPNAKEWQLKFSESSDSTESEERGTEADDEKGPILKGLPAPPLRGRKGLKGSKTPQDQTPAISPFPTPTVINDRRPSYFLKSEPRRASKIDTTERARSIEAYQKYTRRRRAEIARRCTEGILVALIGVAASRKAFTVGRFGDIFYELCSSSILLAFLCLSFPLRVALHKLRSGHDALAAIKAGFHIPSAFDPGPLLYPVFLPFFISTSLMLTDSTVLIANMVLGISSVPLKLVPYGYSDVCGYLHWTLSLIPLLRNAAIAGQPLADSRLHRLDAEGLSLLFPLHQATLATLKYLTSTSLDPAEIQLLSTGLINLYLYAGSPQAEILRVLLWIGPICLFLFCQKPLSLEVRLARIPSWKFARNKSPRTGLLGAAEDFLNMIMPYHRYNQSQSLGSDDEDYEHLKSARRMVRTQTRLRRNKTGGPQSDLEPILSEQERERMYGNGLQRSLTTAANGMAASNSPRKRKQSLNVSNIGLLALTYTQAQACKWIISGYVFLAVATIILVVVRHHVSVRALSSNEPFGWAVGYLFGDIQPFRLWVVSNNLDAWICLPKHCMHTIVKANCGWIEQVRQTQLGPANTRLLVAGYCVVVLTTGIGIVLRLRTVADTDTRRKVFHGIMVAMLLPTIFIDPCFIALALVLILAGFLLLDLFRASQLPPVSKPLTNFLAPYVDGRDYRGPVIVSHIFLLIGCAIPLWLSLAGSARTGSNPWAGWDTEHRELSMISGVVCVGMGDAAASLIGRRYGRTKWFWGGGKSLEGSLAFAVAVTAGLAASYMWLRVGGWIEADIKALPYTLFKMALAGSGASVLESVLTAGNDNVIVPIGLWLMTRGLSI